MVPIVIGNVVWGVARGVTKGGQGGNNSPGANSLWRRWITARAPELLLEAPKSPNNVTGTFFNTANLPSKELRFDHRGAKLRPWGRRFDQGDVEFVFCLEFCFTVALAMKLTTRRCLLPAITSLFDQLGFVAPVLLQVHSIYHSLCEQELEWGRGRRKEAWTAWILKFDIFLLHF